MSPPSRKKKPKGAESPPTDDIQVVDFTGRHTAASCESGPVLAAGGSNQPLCDSPVPLLEASAVAPASAVSTARTHNSLPVSTSVSEIGHPPTTSSSSHTAASDASDIRQQPDIELDSDYDIEIDVSDQEEYFPPPPEDTMQEASDPLEPDFAAPIIIQGVQVPAKQKRHPFDGLYAPREEEEPPKDATKKTEFPPQLYKTARATSKQAANHPSEAIRNRDNHPAGPPRDQRDRNFTAEGPDARPRPPGPSFRSTSRIRVDPE
uniref:Uncharacterized protein n=1 Tax=Caenorhabditis japonica TaxID=281687 RepID=A0A8R1ISZ8_CAEJA